MERAEAELISGVQVLLERGELRIAKRLPQLGSLVRELMDMRMTVSLTGRARMGAEGCGEHDDLVTALALACWRARQPHNRYGEGRLPGS